MFGGTQVRLTGSWPCKPERLCKSLCSTHLKRLGKCVDEQLGLARYGARVITQRARQLQTASTCCNISAAREVDCTRFQHRNPLAEQPHAHIRATEPITVRSTWHHRHHARTGCLAKLAGMACACFCLGIWVTLRNAQVSPCDATLRGSAAAGVFKMQPVEQGQQPL